MIDDGRPALQQVDHQCLSAAAASVTTTWFGSEEPVEVVAGWYRRTLDGYVERAPHDWARQRDTGTDLVVVAPAGQWPAGTPAPTHGWGDRFRTLVMQSSIVSLPTPAARPEPPRRRWWSRIAGPGRRRPG